MSDTNYNDGKWHGWNGGECPVHPLSVVEVATEEGLNTDRAENWDWHTDIVPIVAFRVVEEYMEPREEPREWSFSPNRFLCWYDSQSHMVRIREVMEDD
jgi:hypothetical protein